MAMRTISTTVELEHELSGSDAYEHVELSGLVDLENEVLEVTAPDIELFYSDEHCREIRDALFNAACRQERRETAARDAVLRVVEQPRLVSLALAEVAS